MTQKKSWKQIRKISGIDVGVIGAGGMDVGGVMGGGGVCGLVGGGGGGEGLVRDGGLVRHNGCYGK